MSPNSPSRPGRHASVQLEPAPAGARRRDVARADLRGHRNRRTADRPDAKEWS